MQMGHYFSLLAWAVHSDFFLKRIVWKGKDTLTVEKPDVYYLGKVIKVNINSCKSYQYCVPLRWCDVIKVEIYPCVLAL